LQVSWAIAGHSLKEGGPGYNVQCFSLSSILDEIKEQYIDLIKMDIEGEEFPVIKNLNNDVFEKVDRWIIECHRKNPKEQNDLQKIFEKNSYKVMWYKDNNQGLTDHIYSYKTNL